MQCHCVHILDSFQPEVGQVTVRCVVTLKGPLQLGYIIMHSFKLVHRLGYTCWQVVGHSNITVLLLLRPPSSLFLSHKTAVELPTHSM